MNDSNAKCINLPPINYDDYEVLEMSLRCYQRKLEEDDSRYDTAWYKHRLEQVQAMKDLLYQALEPHLHDDNV